MIGLNSRFDCLILWGTTGDITNEVLILLSEEPNLKVLKIISKNVKDMKSLVRQVYSHDYAPRMHLKEKTRYLVRQSSHVTFIFLHNLKPLEDYSGVGSFRHIECLRIKAFKEKVRDIHNPYEGTVRSHLHVIHATDNESQAFSLLKHVGYSSFDDLLSKNLGVTFPAHLGMVSQYSIIRIKLINLMCSLANEPDELIPLKDSPHYGALTGHPEEYQRYVSRSRGKTLKDNHTIEQLLRLFREIEYGAADYANDLIIVKENNEQLVIADGLHRAACLLAKGVEEVAVCKILD